MGMKFCKTSTRTMYLRVPFSLNLIGPTDVRLWLKAEVLRSVDLRPLHPSKQTYRGPMSAPGTKADHLQSGGATEAVREAGPGPILGDISERPTANDRRPRFPHWGSGPGVSRRGRGVTCQ